MAGRAVPSQSPSREVTVVGIVELVRSTRLSVVGATPTRRSLAGCFVVSFVFVFIGLLERAVNCEHIGIFYNGMKVTTVAPMTLQSVPQRIYDCSLAWSCWFLSSLRSSFCSWLEPFTFADAY